MPTPTTREIVEHLAQVFKDCELLFTKPYINQDKFFDDLSKEIEHAIVNCSGGYNAMINVTARTETMISLVEKIGSVMIVASENVLKEINNIRERKDA